MLFRESSSLSVVLKMPEIFIIINNTSFGASREDLLNMTFYPFCALGRAKRHHGEEAAEKKLKSVKK